jgi:hypothetical protein
LFIFNLFPGFDSTIIAVKSRTFALKRWTRPGELRRMAQEVAREGIMMLARTSHPAKPNLEKIA